MGFKVLINLTIVLTKSLYFYGHKKCHSLPGISRKVYITAKFLKTEFDKYDTSWVSDFSITSIYLIQFIMGQNCHNSC